MPTNPATPTGASGGYFATTVTDAASAESLYREGAVLFDIEQGQIFWRDQRYRITDLLPGATIVVTYGSRPTVRADVTRLLERWGLPIWTVPDTDTDDLRGRLESIAAASASS